MATTKRAPAPPLRHVTAARRHEPPHRSGRAAARAWTTWVVAAILSSASFSALHAFNPEYYWFGFAYAFLLGILLCLVVVRTGSLWLPIAFHVSFNFTQSVLGMPDRGGEILYLLSWVLSLLLVFRALPQRAAIESRNS